MVIHTVKIRNFRCFGQEPDGGWGMVFAPGSGLNLLVGSNGSGKTSLVDAIDLVLNYEGRSNRSLLTEYDFPDCDVAKQMEIQVTLVDLGQVLAVFESDVQWIDPQDGVPVELKGVEPDDNKHLKAVVISFKAGLDSHDGEIVWRWVLPKTSSTELAEERELTRSQHESLGYFRIRPAITAGSFTLGEYSALGRHLRKLRYRLGKLPERLRPRMEMPACYLEGLACDSCPQAGDCQPANDEQVSQPDAAGAPTIGAVLKGLVSFARDVLGPRQWGERQTSLGPRYGGLQSSLSALTLGLRASGSQPTAFIPFERLSAGEKYALSFAVATARVPGDLPPVIVAEEPETSLHPTAVAKIVSGLQVRRRGGTPQVIMTTHSESVLRCYSPEHVFILNPNHQPVLVSSVLQRHWPSAQKQQMPYTLECVIMPGGAGALFCDKILLMEGASEAVTSGELSRIAARCSTPEAPCRSLASIGWAVLSAHASSHIPDFVRLLTSLGKKVAVLLDGDDPGKQVAEQVKAIVPTFIFTSTTERLPVLEDALLLGLRPDLQDTALERFYVFSGCSSCGRRGRGNKCWHRRKCDQEENRPLHKVDLQDICLALYAQNGAYPPAFSALASRLDNSGAGEVIQLTIDAVST